MVQNKSGRGKKERFLRLRKKTSERCLKTPDQLLKHQLMIYPSQGLLFKCKQCKLLTTQIVVQKQLITGVISKRG